MTKSENLFHQIVKENPNGIAGKMFGAKCIKSISGKTAAFFWEENMVFKLDEKNQEKAFKISGAKIGSHLYAPEKQMKGWISIPKNQSENWTELTQKALEYVNSLKK